MGIPKRERNTICWALFAGLTLVSVIFARDVFALQTPLLRLEPFDIIAGVFVIVSLMTFRRYTFSHLSFAPIIALFGIALTGGVSTVVAFQHGYLVSISDATIDSLRYLLLGSIFLFGIQTLRTKRAQDLLLSVWLGCAAIVAIVALGQTLAVLAIEPFISAFLWENVRGGGDRIAATMRWQGPLVAYLGVTLPLILARTISDEMRHLSNARIWRIGYGGVVISFILALFFTGSRSALLMLPLAVVPLLTHLQNHRRSMVLTTAITVGIGSIAYILQADAISRIVRRGAASVASPFEINRVINWTEAIGAWLSTNLLFGLGPRQTVYFTGKGAHSSYVGILVERGLFGLGFLLLFVGAMVVSGAVLIHQWRTEGHLMDLAFGVAIFNLLLYAGLAEGLTYRFLYPFIVLTLARVDATDVVGTWTFKIRELSGKSSTDVKAG